MHITALLPPIRANQAFESSQHTTDQPPVIHKYIMQTLNHFDEQNIRNKFWILLVRNQLNGIGLFGYTFTLRTQREYIETNLSVFLLDLSKPDAIFESIDTPWPLSRYTAHSLHMHHAVHIHYDCCYYYYLIFVFLSLVPCHLILYAASIFALVFFCNPYDSIPFVMHLIDVSTYILYGAPA